MPPEAIKILLANKDKDELAELVRVVELAGHDVVDLAITVKEVGNAVIQHQPDLAMVLIEGDEGHAMELVVEIRSFAAMPVTLMAREVDDEMLKEAVDNSLEVLHLPGDMETVGKVIDATISRHREMVELERRVGDLDGILERRSTIEQAKGILMERHGVDDHEAFTMIRCHARENQIRVVDVAASVIAVRSLLASEAPRVGEAA